MISLWLKLVVYYLKQIWSYNALKLSPTSPTKASFNVFLAEIKWHNKGGGINPIRSNVKNLTKNNETNISAQKIMGFQ